MAGQITGSSLERVFSCPASVVLPSVKRDTAAAQVGRARHAALQAIAEGRDKLEAAKAELSGLSEAQVAKALVEVTGIDESQVPRGEAEVAMAYNPIAVSARRLPTKSRKYSLDSHEIPGTADMIVWDRDPLLVIDWKGQFASQTDHTTQLEFYGLCAALIAGRDRVVCSVRSVSESGAIAINKEWLMTAEDLDAFAFRISVAIKRVAEQLDEYKAGRKPDVSVGPHCRYCSCFEHCPAYVSIIARMLGLSDPESISDTDLADAYVLSRDVERSIEAVQVAVRNRLPQVRTISSSDGKVIKFNSIGSIKVTDVKKAG